MSNYGAPANNEEAHFKSKVIALEKQLTDIIGEGGEYALFIRGETMNRSLLNCQCSGKFLRGVVAMVVETLKNQEPVA